MGWLADVFRENKPCFAFHMEWDDEKPKQSSQEMKLIAENRALKKQLSMRKINAIDVDSVELLE